MSWSQTLSTKTHFWWTFAKTSIRGQWQATFDMVQGAVDTVRVPQWARQLACRNATRDLLEGLKTEAFQPTWERLQRIEAQIPAAQSAWFRQQKNQAIELALEHADESLVSGDVQTALAVVRQLSEKKILDWRADRIASAAQLIDQADQLIAKASFDEALGKLALAARQRSDLYYLDDRLNHVEQQQRAYQKLVQAWTEAKLENDSAGIELAERAIRKISPKSSILSDRSRSPNQSNTEWPLESEVAEADDTNRWSLENYARAETGFVPHNFWLWIDGVGGYLVCRKSAIWIGRYVEQPNVDIPLKSDLLRRHACLLATTTGYDLTPGDRSQVVNRKLKHGDRLCLNENVSLRYSQPHPLSGTARLDFESGHRTVPWCDAILLLNDRLVIGPSSDCHIRIRSLSTPLIIQVDGNQVWVESGDTRLNVDGRSGSGRQALRADSRMTNSEISIQMESLNVHSG